MHHVAPLEQALTGIGPVFRRRRDQRDFSNSTLVANMAFLAEKMSFCRTLNDQKVLNALTSWLMCTLAPCRPIGRPTYRSTVDRLPTDSWVTVGRQSVNLSADCRSTRSQPTVGRLSASGLSPEILQYHLKNETGPRFHGGAGPNTRLHGIWVKTCSNVSLKSTRVTKMRPSDASSVMSQLWRRRFIQ